MKEKIAIIIPCYNVEKTIERVIFEIRPDLIKQISYIVCIDNNSSDNTRTILESIHESNHMVSNKLVLLFNNENYGYGGSIKKSFDYCINNDIDFFIILHSDGQSDAYGIVNNFLNIHRQNSGCDIVLASRFCKQSNLQGYRKLRIAGNYIFNAITYIISGLRMSDAGTAIIFCKTQVVKNIPYHSFTDGYQFHPQLNIFVYENKEINLLETPLNWKDSEIINNLNLFKYGIGLIKILTRYLVFGRLLRKKKDQIFYNKNQL
jgi:glycosyltransferase involved in cell wall biosynthesis